MTRKDYEKIAFVLNTYSVLDSSNKDMAYLRKQMVDSFANVLAADNPRFDREKFLAACGITE